MKFKVHMQRYVEETATLVVEAETIEEALDEAQERSGEEGITWGPGDEIVYGDVMEVTDGYAPYAAHDESEELIWER